MRNILRLGPKFLIKESHLVVKLQEILPSNMIELGLHDVKIERNRKHEANQDAHYLDFFPTLFHEYLRTSSFVSRKDYLV